MIRTSRSCFMSVRRGVVCSWFRRQWSACRFRRSHLRDRRISRSGSRATSRRVAQRTLHPAHAATGHAGAPSARVATPGPTGSGRTGCPSSRSHLRFGHPRTEQHSHDRARTTCRSAECHRQARPTDLCGFPWPAPAARTYPHPAQYAGQQRRPCRRPQVDLAVNVARMPSYRRSGRNLFDVDQEGGRTIVFKVVERLVGRAHSQRFAAIAPNLASNDQSIRTTVSKTNSIRDTGEHGCGRLCGRGTMQRLPK